MLKDGTDLNQTGSFYLAARPYAEKNGAFIQGVLTTFSEADALTRSQREQSIALLAKRWAYRTGYCLVSGSSSSHHHQTVER